MKKISIYLILIHLLIQINLRGQNTEKMGQTLGSCSSYLINNNKVIFNCENNAKVLLQFCSGQVIKVWISTDGNFKRNNQSFAVINEDLGWLGNVNVNEETTAYEIFTEQLRIRVNKKPFKLQVFDKYQKLLFGDYNEKGFVKNDKHIASYKTLKSDEQFFGLGEKSGTLNRRGKSYKMWNSDQPCYGVNEDPLYKSIPFFMSTNHYGIFFDNTYKTEFKFGSESNEYYSFEAPAGEMIYYFMYGNDYKQIIQNYIALTGNPIMPPKWALGFSQCRGNYTSETQAREIAAEFRIRKIPCDIIYQDIGWVEGLQDFDWKKSNYQNPKQMVKELGDQGFKMIISQDPVISQTNKKQWEEANSKGYFAKDIRSGKSYDMPWPWGGNCGVVDFTKPDVADWWGDYQQKPLNDGVRGFWTDMGEPAWSNEDATDRLSMKHYLGMHDEIHNVYGFTWDKVVTEQFYKHNPNKRVFQMTRAAYAGLQRYTFGWSGDSGNGNNVLEGWNQFANQIPVGLSAGLGIIPFWTSDISGYCGDIKDYDAMSELYVRWMQFGVFNPLSRAHHEGGNAVEPWVFGTEVENITRTAIELKYQLFPYIYTYARVAHDTGLPLMRALFLEYPNDSETFDLNGQFLFGDELLVAPVVEKGAVTKKLYLPEGEWINYNDGKSVYKGKQWITVEAPLDVIPLFVKKGAIIPSMPIMQYIHEKPNYHVSFDVYPDKVGKESSFVLYEDDGESRDYEKGIFCKTKITAIANSLSYAIHISAREDKGYKPLGSRNFIIKLHTNSKPKSVFVNSIKIKKEKPEVLNAKGFVDYESLSFSWDEEKGIIYVKLPDNGQDYQININSGDKS
ncbi:glycosyl hydrolase family 31 [Flavobacterium aquariorum]|uniref:Glycosyl hydrolase family 31 n=1 Tax=Flavobacterium aquariorum TaxID=2217670 RepID=A0A2W7TPQ7_9FLAO|nr:TIM-barrel domain-containing protein [Flavobacterium aquariorum]PZX92038.1 glycosyl hydrolase family 31 [Flavobacterium aquariorum]